MSEDNISLAKEVLWDTYLNPAGSLWNYGTTPTRKELIEWQARQDLAVELLSILDRESLIDYRKRNSL